MTGFTRFLQNALGNRLSSNLANALMEDIILLVMISVQIVFFSISVESIYRPYIRKVMSVNIESSGRENSYITFCVGLPDATVDHSGSH